MDTASHVIANLDAGQLVAAAFLAGSLWFGVALTRAAMTDFSPRCASLSKLWGIPHPDSAWWAKNWRPRREVLATARTPHSGSTSCSRRGSVFSAAHAPAGMASASTRRSSR